LGLVRKLLSVRKANAHFRTGDHFFYNHWDRYQSKGVLLFSRSDAHRFSLVALNFSDTEVWVPFWFPKAGTYKEELGNASLTGVGAYQEYWLCIPSNYGRIWTL
jgi:glycosidase